ncbi:hypothetical protein IV203_008993 [Nitzschia inconspicua]|uniref:Uncharacterized protein n=1 Tax=Nitzschia inconspicua TaxID=303405 RepID=A0A9K3PMI2_9STRA|nr:hypothetical protein IV203_008993 [Nitzschia inconspicua]
MMRKRKALSSVDGNILSKPPMRRLDSDGEFSLESWEERALADSKTPKISNVGGSASQQPATKKRLAHRRPPLPTRPNHGGLGSSILNHKRNAQSNVPTRGGISSRWSPKRTPSDHATRVVDRITPRFQRNSAMPLTTWVEETTQPVLHLSPTSRNGRVANDSIIYQHQTKASTLTLDDSHCDPSEEVACRTVSFALANGFVPRPASSVTELSPTYGDVQINSKVKLFQKAAGAGTEERESDDDMNCESSDEDLLFNSSDSSLDVQDASREIRPGSAEQVLNNQDHLKASVDDQNANLNSTTEVEHLLQRTPYNDISRTENRDAVRKLVNGESRTLPYEDSELVGATIGTTRMENLEEDTDTDLTDLTSLSSDDGNSSTISCEHIEEDGDEPRLSEETEISTDGDEKVGNTPVPKTPRRRTFFKDTSAALSCESSVDAQTSNPFEEESIEAWSIDGYTDSPILLEIEGKKYVHPPLPAGWRIKISKTHNRPIYIHPDIGRTFHCPVDLPRDVVYVRRKDGKLERRPKIHTGTDNCDPRAGRAPDTPPSVTQQSPGSSATSPSLDSHQSERSISNSESTTKLIRGALKHSAMCIKSSSLNLQRAKKMMKTARETPSTMSDVVRLYETERMHEQFPIIGRHTGFKDGDECDISCSERSREFPSVSSDIERDRRDDTRYKSGSCRLENNALSPVLETSLPTDWIVEDLVPGRAIEARVSRISRISEDKIPASNKKRPWTQFSPETSNESRDRLQPHDLHCFTGAEVKVPPVARNSVQGEYIDGWFTPNASTDSGRESYEEVATLRHSAKPPRSGQNALKSPPTNTKRDRALLGNRKAPLKIENENGPTLNENADSNFSSSCHSGIVLEHERGPSPKSRLQNNLSPSMTQKAPGNTIEAAERGKRLLPFFDIFEQHLAEEDGEQFHCVQTKDKSFRSSSNIENIQSDLEDNLPDWKSPNCSEIKGSSPERGSTTSENDFESSPQNNIQKLGPRNEAEVVSKTVTTLTKTKGSAEKGCNESRSALSNQSAHFINDPSQHGKCKRSVGEVHITAAQQISMKEKLPEEMKLSSSKVDNVQHKRDVCFEASPASEFEFHAGGDQSTGLSSDDFPGPELENFPVEESGEINEFKKIIQTIQKEDTKSPEKTNQEHDPGSEKNVSSTFDDDGIEGPGADLCEGMSPIQTYNKRRRMNWRVLNPTYPRCSLQRLDDIVKSHLKKGRLDGRQEEK